MTFALVVISLLITVPFLLLLVDLMARRSSTAAASARGLTSEVVADRPARRPGTIAPGEGMVHRPNRNS